MLQTSSIEAIERCLHIQRRADSPVRIIFVRNGCAEYRHHRISDIFLNGAAMPPYLLRHQVEVPCQNCPHVLRVQSIRQRCRTRNIRKHNRHHPPFLWRRQPIYTTLVAIKRRCCSFIISSGGAIDRAQSWILPFILPDRR